MNKTEFCNALLSLSSMRLSKTEYWIIMYFIDELRTSREFTINQTELAAELNITREALNRNLRKLVTKRKIIQQTKSTYRFTFPI